MRDKDGISAAALAVQLATDLHAAGSSLLGRLDELHRRHGVHATGQVTVHLPATGGGPGTSTATERLRTHPPEQIAGRPVTSVVDYQRDPGPQPATDMLAFRLGDNDRVIVRPSGTEPKLKVYIETTEAVAQGDLAAARRRAEDRLDQLTQAMRSLVGA